jgi:antitoxin ParD1/3/4
MDIALSDELQSFVLSAVRDGSFRSESEVISKALRLLQRHEQLRRAVHAGVDQLDRGEFSEYGEDDRYRFLEDIKNAGRNASDRTGDSG